MHIQFNTSFLRAWSIVAKALSSAFSTDADHNPALEPTGVHGRFDRQLPVNLDACLVLSWISADCEELHSHKKGFVPSQVITKGLAA